MTTTPNSKAGQLTEKIMRIFWDDGIPLETKDYNRAWSHITAHGRTFYSRYKRSYQMTLPKGVEHLETLWACSCGYQWFASAKEQPESCPKCGIVRLDLQPKPPEATR